MWSSALIFPNKEHGLQKKTLEKIVFFAVDYVKIIELHTVHNDVTHNLSRWNSGCNDIYKKDQ